MNLFIDIGNTNIKLNYNFGDGEKYVSYLTKQEFSVDSFYNSFPEELKNAKLNKVIIVSVVSSVTSLIEGVFKKYYQKRPHLIGPPMKTQIKMNVENPKEVGTDLVCLAVFLASKTKNGIMVNMGTATTIIHVVNNTLMGVIISAGIHIQLKTLIKNASKLVDSEIKPTTSNLGRNTQEALSIGIMNGHLEMVRGLVKNIDQSADVYISGGNSRLFKDTSGYNYIKEATLEGSKIIFNINQKTS